MEPRLCAVRINSLTLKCDYWSRQSLQGSSARTGNPAEKGTPCGPRVCRQKNRRVARARRSRRDGL